MLRHTYANLAEFKDYITKTGSTVLTDAQNDARRLSILEDVSRLVDFKAHRSIYGSGFGPRLGTNRYDGDGCNELFLRDDLFAVTSVTIRPTTGSSTTYSPVIDTDYYGAGFGGSYALPYRRLILHGQGTPTVFGRGYRVTDVVGTWSYPYLTRVIAVTTSEALDDAETGVDVSAATDLAAGTTILVDSEQMYVTAVSGTTLTVERGVNGTTAASHLTAAAITRYVYDPAVHNLTLRLGLRRWKARDAGADGTDGGGDVPMTSAREGEDTIIRRGLGRLMLVGQF